jgi:hypothetical protein
MKFKGIYDLPIFNFFMVNTTGELSYLGDGKQKELSALWDKINDELVNALGVNEQIQMTFSGQREMAIAKINALVRGGHYVTRLEILKGQQKLIEKDADEVDFYSSKAILESILGYQINEHTTSVYAYYKYVEAGNKISKNGKNKAQ